MNLYGHLYEDSGRALAERLDETFRGIQEEAGMTSTVSVALSC
jgi:hypothetical protein